MRPLAVYNTCEISGKDNLWYYLRAIEHLHAQNAADICVSGCMMKPATKAAMKAQLPFCTFVWTDEVLPLNVTFNFAVRKMRELRGDYSHYVYFDSGIDVSGARLTDLLDHCEGDNACVASIVDTDAGYTWLKIDPPRPGEPPLHLRPGKTVNMHAQVWTHEFVEQYDGRILPDVFASDCSEQATPYLCAAIGRRFVLAPVTFHHAHDMDGGSSGFKRGSGWDCQLFRSPKDIRQLCAEGHENGWGFEEFSGHMMHKPEFFNDDGYAKTDQLYRWLKANLFLQDFDYGAIKHEVA